MIIKQINPKTSFIFTRKKQGEEDKEEK